MQKLIKIMGVMLLTTLSASLAAAPFGYSVTADSSSDFTQSLFLIDLATGTETWVSLHQSQVPFVESRQRRAAWAEVSACGWKPTAGRGVHAEIESIVLRPSRQEACHVDPKVVVARGSGGLVLGTGGGDA